MPAGGEPAAREFYAGILGLEEVPKPAALAARGGTWFRGGDATIHLGVDPAFAPAQKGHPALTCSNYAQLLNRLADRGIAVTPDLLPLEGKAHCYIADPFGNRIEIIDGSR